MNKTPLQLAAALLVSGLLAASGAHAATTITAWNFENDAIAVNNNPAASTGSGTASSLGMGVYATPNVGTTTDDVLAGAAADAGANGVGNLSQIWRIRAQGPKTAAANGWSSLAPIGTQGAQFNASTAGYNGISVSFDWYATTQGEANLQFQYTTDGSTWNNAALSLNGSDGGLVVMSNTSNANLVSGSYVSDNVLTNGALAGQDWFTGITATITDPSAANDASFAFRLVNAATGSADVSTQGTALNNTSGNWRFDNVSVSGTQISPVPEPTSAAMMALGAVALLVGIRRRG